MFLLLSKTLIPTVVLLIGIFGFQFMSRAQKLIFFQVFAYVVILTLTKQVMIYQKINGLEKTTVFLYNIYMPVEGSLLLFSAYTFFENKFFKLMSVFLISAMFVAYVAELMIRPAGSYLKIFDLVENLSIIVLFGIVICLEFRAKTAWYNSPTLYIGVGLLIFSACTLPYMSIQDFLQANYSANNKFLYRLINGFMSNVRYIFMGIGFWLVRYNAPRTTYSNEL